MFKLAHDIIILFYHQRWIQFSLTIYEDNQHLQILPSQPHLQCHKFGTWYVAFTFVPIGPIQCEIHLGNFHGVQSSASLFLLSETTSSSPFLILPLILVLTLKLFLLGSLGVSLSLVLQIKKNLKKRNQIKKPLNFDSKTMFVFMYTLHTPQDQTLHK